MLAIPSGFSFSCFPAEPTVALQHERIDAVAVKQAVREGDVLRLTLDVLPQKDCLKVVFRNRAVESIAADGFVFDAERSLLLRI